MERMYEQCRSPLALYFRLTTAQVYGGSVSLVFGAYLWSWSNQVSICNAGVTVVSGLSAVFNSNRISGSEAVTLTTGGALQAPNHTFQTSYDVRTCTLESLYSNIGPSLGSCVRRARELLLSPFLISFDSRTGKWWRPGHRCGSVCVQQPRKFFFLSNFLRDHHCPRLSCRSYR